MFDWGTVVMTSIVQVGIGLLFKRYVEKRDEEMYSLKNEVSKMRDERMVQIEKDIEHGKTSRGRLYNEIETLGKDRARHDQKIEHLEKMTSDYSESVLKLERVGTKVEGLVERVEQVSLIQFEQANKLSAVSSVVENALRESKK